MPDRIQRRRTRGWRMPDGATYVGRPTRWGNPVAVGDWASVGSQWRDGDRCTTSTWLRTAQEAVWYFRGGLFYGGLVTAKRNQDRHAVALPSVDEIRTALAGRDLVCWCPLDQPCHADVLLEIANTPEDHR